MGEGHSSLRASVLFGGSIIVFLLGVDLILHLAAVDNSILHILLIVLVALALGYILGQVVGYRIAQRVQQGMMAERLATADQAITELGHLYQMAVLSTTALDMEKTLRRLAEGAAHMVPGGVSGVFLLDEGEDLLRLRASYGYMVVHGGDGDIAISTSGQIGTMLQRGEVCIIDDLATDSRVNRQSPTSAVLMREGIQSAFIAPLVSRGRFMGALAVGMRVPHHFTAGEVRLLTAVANQAASAIERAQLYQMVNDSLQRRVTELAVLHEISRSGVGGLGQEHVLRHLRETVARHPIYPIMELGLYDPVAGLITIYPLHGVEVAQLTYSQIPVDQGIMGWVVHHGEAVNSGDVRGDPRYLACTAGTRSEVCVPLRAGDKIIGALNVESPRPHAFTDADVRFLTTLASHMAVMLDNAILHEGLQQHIRNLRSLQDVSRALVTRLASAELYEGVVDHAQRIFAADATSLMLWDDRGESLRIVAARGLSPEYQQAQRIPRARVEEVIAQRGEAAPLLVRDLQQTPYGDANMVVAEDLRSVLSLPIRRSRTLVSILNIYSKGKPRVFTDHEVDLAQLYADEIAVVMENISLYEDLKGKAEQLAILNAVGIAVTSTLKLDEVLWTVYEQVQPLVRQDSFAVAIYDEIQEALVFPLRVEHGTIMFEPLVINLRSEPLTLTGWVLRTQRPLLLHDLNDPSEEKPPVRILQVGEPTRSWLGVPLVFQGRAMGAMIVQSHQPHAFNERDQFLLSTLASYTAVAIENARLHESLVEQARRDSLTQCYTHGYFLTRLDEEVRRAGETGRPLSLIMLDVDYFKEFNDHYGHVTGDAILQAIVQSIRGNIKKTDVVGRWGGEEFGIILPNATSEQARMVAERIRHTVAGVAMTDRSGRPIRPPTISQGIATYPDQADSAIGLVDRADQVLYVAKARGRDQIEVAA